MIELTFEELGEKVGRGIVWLGEHDPDGAFHLWFKSGLTERSPMPGQADERREEWQRYYRQRVIWERLDAQYAEMERRR